MEYSTNIFKNLTLKIQNTKIIVVRASVCPCVRAYGREFTGSEFLCYTYMVSVLVTIAKS